MLFAYYLLGKDNKIMSISEEIDKIIKRRKSKVSDIEGSLEKIEKITSDIMDVVDMKKEILNNVEAFNVSPDGVQMINELSVDEYNKEFDILKRKYESVIERFKRDEINIAVVGSARQGKSRLLQSISNLKNNIIPAFESDDCTGASSVIKNAPGEPVTAEVSFMTEQEVVQCIQKYLDAIFGEKNIIVGSFSKIGTLNIKNLEERMKDGDPAITKFEHLCKYVEHFEEWSPLIRERKKLITDPSEIQKYVAQHNDKDENDPERENYYNYLAVKEVIIKCEFRNADSGKIVLRDTIGLGDTSLGIEDKMLDAIGSYSDAAIIVRRPEVSTGKFNSTDDALYKSLYDKFNEKNMDKWLFWLNNRTDGNSIYGDNESRCIAFEHKIKDKNWKLADNFIVNVSDENAVNDIFSNVILKTLIKNIDDIDDGILDDIRKQSETLYNHYIKVQRDIDTIINSVSYNENEKNAFINERWNEFYERKFMKGLLDFKNELNSKKDNDCEKFKDEIDRILNNSRNLVPSVERLKRDLDSAGHNRPGEVYAKYLDDLRNKFMAQFLNIDEFVFDKQVQKFKERIVNIFADDAGGRMKYIVPIDENNKINWLNDINEEFENKYPQFKTAFDLIINFTLSIRGFLMHRIRSRIDKLELEAEEFSIREQSNDKKAMEINMKIKKKLIDVVEEIEDEMRDGFYKDPNRIFYAIIAEFYDRINFSRTEGNFIDAEVHWKEFYTDYANKVWQDEYSKNGNLSDLYRKWIKIQKQLKNTTKKDFEICIN